MKRILLPLLLQAAAYLPLAAQPSYAQQDELLSTLYSVISGEAGEARDWGTFRELFLPEARLAPSRAATDSTKGSYRVLSPEDYIRTSGKWLEENGFFEKEIHRSTQEYGSIAHVFSTYESYRSASDKEPFARGINSIQLFHDGERWWILSIFWMGETAAHPIPKEYLPD